jgi:hypothetical protein
VAKKHKNATKSSSGRPLGTEDLEQIVGGATTAQYDATKQALLGEMNNADITNAVAADAASIAANPSHIATAITDIESHAAADHVSQAAALAALDAATYGNAKVGGVDAVATELTKVLTSGTGEADMAHLAALGADPTTLVTELNQAVNVLAMGSSDGHTALGLSTAAAVDWVEAKLEVAAGSEAVADNVAAAVQSTIAAANAFNPTAAGHTAFQNAVNAANADTAEAQAATALQTLLDTSHQGEVAEGKGIDAVMTALGSHAGQVAADAALLQGLTGAAAVTAGAQQVAAVEAIAGVQKDVALVALDLMAQGNAGVQQALSTELTSGAIETNLAQAVATGGLTGDQAVQTLNLVVADLAQNSVNAGTVPALEQGFAAAQADVALANAAGSLATADNLAASGYNGAVTTAQATADHQQANLAASLQTLINTNYAAEVALVTELNSIAGSLGASAATYISEGGNLIANPSLAAGYISAIETAGQSAEAAATPGSPHGAFSVDAALTLLAVYSHGNPAVLAAIETRLASGAAENDLANLAALGVITPAQAITNLSGMVDALAAASPNNSVTLTASDGQPLTLDRNSAFDWAEGQLAKVVLTMQNAVATDTLNLVAVELQNAFGLASHAQIVAAQNALNTAIAEAGNVNQFATLLETSHANEIITGLGIDNAWVSARASVDAAAVIAAGTSVVQTGYSPESQVSAAATAQANIIMQTADQQELTDFNFAQQVMQASLQQVWNSNVSAGQTAAATAVENAGQQQSSLFAQGGTFVENNFAAARAAVAAYEDPNFSNFATLGEDIIAGALTPKWFTALNFASLGMADLLDSSAVSGVIGASAAAGLAQTFTVLHDATKGTITLFTTVVQMDGAAAIQLGQQAVTVGENTFTLTDDLFHGNTGALASDAKTLFTNLGTATETLAEDMAGILTLGVPLQDAQALMMDATQVLGKLGTDIIGASAMSSIESFVKADGMTILQDIGSNLGTLFSGIGGTIAGDFSSFGSDVENEAKSIGNDIASAGSSLGSDISSGWHDFTSLF